MSCHKWFVPVICFQNVFSLFFSFCFIRLSYNISNMLKWFFLFFIYFSYFYFFFITQIQVFYLFPFYFSTTQLISFPLSSSFFLGILLENRKMFSFTLKIWNQNAFGCRIHLTNTHTIKSVVAPVTKCDENPGPLQVTFQIST